MFFLIYFQVFKKLFINFFKLLFVFIIDYKIDFINVLSKLKILVYIYKLIFVLLEYLSK